MASKIILGFLKISITFLDSRIPSDTLLPMEVKKRILNGMIELAQSRRRWDKLTPEEQQGFIRQGFDPNKSLA